MRADLKPWIAIALLLLLSGCAIKRPVLALYCDQREGNRCVKWAQHKELPCVRNEYGDCKPGQ